MTLKDKFIKADRYSLLRTTLIAECEKIAEDFAMGFAKWCRSGSHNEKFTEKSIPLNELLKIYKNETTNK